MLLITIYLTVLLIAPQLWIEPFVGIRVDLYIYPVWAAYLLLSGKTKGVKITQADKFYLLMIVWIITTTVVNGFNDKSMEIIQNYIKWFVLFKMVGMTIEDTKGLRKATNVLILFGLILSVEGIQHKLSVDGLGWAGQPLGWVDPSVLKAGGTGRTEWINIFDGPGVFCVIYTLILPFLLDYLEKTYATITRIAAFLLTGLVVLAIFYTGSRGGFLATLAIFGFYFATKLKISPSRMALIGGVLSLAFLLAPAYLTSVRDSNRSAQHRVDMWQEGVEMVQQNPVFGIGKGNFARYTGRLIAHNSSIEIMGETGIPGLFFWICLLYATFKSIYLYNQQVESADEKALANAAKISLIGYIVSSMFVTLEYETLYFLLGLCSVYEKEAAKQLGLNSGMKILDKKDYYRILVIIVSWILILKIFFKVYY